MFHHFIRFNERASHLLVDNREQCIRPMTGRKGRSDLTPSCVPVVCGTRQVNQHLLLIGLQYLCVWMLRPFQPFWRFCRLCELVCISDLLPPAALYLVPPSREFCARNKFRWWKMWSVPLVLWSLVYKTFEFQFNDPDCYIFNTTLWWCADLMRLLFQFRSLFSILSGCAWITCATWSLLLSRSHELASKWNICLTFWYFCIRSEDIVSFNTSLDSRKWWSTPTATTPSQATASALKNFLFSWSFLLFLLIFPVQLHLSIFLATLIFLFIISKFYAFPSLRLFEDCQ